MSFSCPNYDLNADRCLKLDTLCVPGRPGCVAEGKVRFSEDIEIRIRRAEERFKERKSGKRMTRHR